MHGGIEGPAHPIFNSGIHSTWLLVHRVWVASIHTPVRACAFVCVCVYVHARQLLRFQLTSGIIAVQLWQLRNMIQICLLWLCIDNLRHLNLSMEIKSLL